MYKFIMQLLIVHWINGKKTVVVLLIVNVKMEIVMNNLTFDDMKEIWDGQKNLTNKPIFIDFYGEW